MNDVVIVGGGPNGLLMAAELAKAGVRPVVLERLAARPTMPKANGLVGRVISALERCGAYEWLSERPPLRMPGFQFGGLPLALSRLSDNPMYSLPIPQRRLEERFEERARSLGAEIRRGHELVSVHQTSAQVTAVVRGPEGPYEVAARFLVAADGGRSTVRKGCGIDFPGITDRGFVGRSGQVVIGAPVAAGAELDLPMGRLRPGTFTRTERGMFAFGMFQPGLYRVAVYEWASTPLPDSDAMPLPELRDAVARVLGADVPMSVPDGEPAALRRSTGVNSRQAAHYRQGRVFLTGDAAHVHSGIGGPGLNLGMQDVLNLSWKLAAVITDGANEDLLETYETERHPVGERVIVSTRAQMALLSPGPNITALRSLLEEFLEDRGNVQRVADLMSGADVRYTTHDDVSSHPLTGRWMPKVPGLLRAGRPVLLTSHEKYAEAAKQWADRVTVATADTPAAEAVLLRPDGYVAWAGESPEELRRALCAWFQLESGR